MVVCLGKPTDLSETRARVPIAARQSVHGMPVIAGSTELAARYRTSYQRPADSIITSQETYKTTSIPGIRRASVCRAKRRWSDSSLQVEDPKASGTPTSLAKTHTPHFRAWRPQWPPIPSWSVHSVKGARSPPLRLALQTCPRRASTRNDTGAMVGRYEWYFQP